MRFHTESTPSNPGQNEHCIERPGDEAPSAETDEPSDLDDLDPDDERWDAFIADDDERDPQPDHGDFWFDD